MVNIQKNVLLAPYTTFKIGGPAKYFVEAKSIEEVQEFCVFAKEKELPIFILGGGSNVLISDQGFKGLVIKIKDSENKESNFRFGGNGHGVKLLEVWVGTPLSKLVANTTNTGLSGLEWAIGIPGTVGGAICGNTGAFGKEMADSIQSVKVFNHQDASISDFKKENCDFSYRDSIFKQGDNLTIIGATLTFKKDAPELIQERLRKNIKQRTESFAHNYKCAGCFFKNIEWKRRGINKEDVLKRFPELGQFADRSKISAGFLIESVGLRGKKIDDVVVSEEHANFILNLGNANAEQILMLSGLVKDRVYSKYGFSLEEEVNLIGFD
ncbi:UDP-N-acetylmuramate dehydrogenase [Patescibacteria group bacterium]